MKAIEYLEEQNFGYDHFTKLTKTGINPDNDNIAQFAEDYHQAKLNLLTIPVVKNWVAVKDSMPENCDQVFVKYENGKYGINEWWESDDCWKYQFDNMIVKEWCKPPCS